MMKVKVMKNEAVLALFKKANEARPDDRPAIYGEIFLGTKRLCERRASKWKGYASYNDLVWAGHIALYNAILTFDPTKCPRFYGWAVPWIKSEIGREAYALKLHHELTDETADFDAMAECHMDDRDPENILLEKERNNILRQAIRALRPDSAFALISAYDMDGYNIKKYENDLSHYQINKIKRNALRCLRSNTRLIEVAVA